MVSIWDLEKVLGVSRSDILTLLNRILKSASRPLIAGNTKSTSPDAGLVYSLSKIGRAMYSAGGGPKMSWLNLGDRKDPDYPWLFQVNGGEESEKDIRCHIYVCGDFVNPFFNLPEFLQVFKSSQVLPLFISQNLQDKKADGRWIAAPLKDLLCPDVC